MLNNPIQYNDPSGHSDSGACGPGEDCDESDEERAEAERNAILQILKEKEKNGCEDDACDNGKEIIAFAVAGLITTAAAQSMIVGEISKPVAIKALEYKSVELGAKCTANPTCLAILNTLIGVAPNIDRQNNTVQPRTSNDIGTWGVKQAEKGGLITAKQIRQFNLGTNQLRIYDGTSTLSGALTEIKTTTTGTVYATKFIRNQVNFDANFGNSVEWIFVNGVPSGPLRNLLESSAIPWTEARFP